MSSKMNHAVLSLSAISLLLAVVFTTTTGISGQANHAVDQDLVADETTIIFRPLFVYRKQQAEAEKRRKLREEWQKQHPNLSYYDYVHGRIGGQ